VGHSYKGASVTKHHVQCTFEGCREAASYKIAARWSDGGFAELKTYGFACSDHLGPVFQRAEERQNQYTPAPNEVVEELAIYRFEPGKRDRQLQRLWGLEDNYRT
jgi:hypothetical protein